MYRSDRFFNKKRNGQHNYYGEEDYLEIRNGTVNYDLKFKDQDFETLPDKAESESESESG